MSRKTVGLLILLVWAAGLGFLYNRTSHRTLEQTLTEVGMRVSPDTYYYILQQDGRQVGAASSALDTSKTRVISAELVRGAFRAGSDTLRIDARSEARFTRGMRLRDFVFRAAGDINPFVVRGVMQEGEDKTLRVTVETKGERPITQETVADAPVFVPSMAPLPLMLTRRPEIGDSVRIAMFDPIGRRLRNVTLRIETDSLFLVADSAVLDSTTHRWVKAHQDSVRGWRVTSRNAPLTAWVDAGGRLIAASEPGGISMVRTAFEIAFENWKLANAPGASADSTRPEK